MRRYVGKIVSIRTIPSQDPTDCINRIWGRFDALIEDDSGKDKGKRDVLLDGFADGTSYHAFSFFAFGLSRCCFEEWS